MISGCMMLKFIPSYEDVMRCNILVSQGLPDDLAWIREGGIASAATYQVAQVMD